MCMRFLSILIAVASLSVLASPAMGELLQMKQLSRACRDHKGSHTDEGHCYVLAHEILKLIRQEKACPPSNANEYEIIDSLQQWRTEHPEVRGIDIREAAAKAMPEVFPCEQELDPPTTDVN